MEQIYSNYSTEISSHKLSNSSQIHIHKFHDDYNSGYRVCTECGFVAQDLLFSQYTPYNEQNKDQFLQKIQPFREYNRHSDVKLNSHPINLIYF